MSRRPPRIPVSYQAIADEEESSHENDSSSSSSPSPSSSSIRIPEYQQQQQQLNHHEELLLLLTTTNKKKDWLLANSPRGNPRLWNGINGTALAASLWLLIELTYLKKDDLMDVADEEQYYYRLVPFYAVYNFTTTVIWCLEDGLCLYYECMMMLSSSQRDRNIGMMLVHAILLVAALYFLVTSIIFFFGDEMLAAFSSSSSSAPAPRDEDELMQQRIIMDQITRDVFTSCLIYLVALLYVCLRETTTATRRGHQQILGGEQGGDCCFPVVCNDHGSKRSYQTIA
jgi:hypothetical protein